MIFKKKKDFNKGFTLIELLVVIAIMMILSSVVTVSLASAKAKARDARRLHDLDQIRTALDLYYTDHGYYPGVACGWNCNEYVTSNNSGWASLTADLAPYIQLPVDPINTINYGLQTCKAFYDNCYVYTYGNVGDLTKTNTNGELGFHAPQYDLIAQFESKGNNLRCGIQQYKYLFGEYDWCGIWSPYLYDVGRTAPIF